MPHTEILTAMDALMESIKITNANLDRLSDSSEKLYSRINILEQDLHERITKKRVYKSIFALYPALVIIFLFVANVDHYKIKTAVKDFNALSDDLKGLGVYANNSY